jgi:hypothetical protein
MDKARKAMLATGRATHCGPTVVALGDSGLVRQLAGKRVSVTVSSVLLSRAHFEPQISVSGILELKETHGRDWFRVVADDGNYVYFERANVAGVVSAENHKTRDGAEAAIYLEISGK